MKKINNNTDNKSAQADNQTAPDKHVQPFNEQQTLLDFPEKFPIKIFGADKPDFIAAVESIVAAHVAESDLLSWKKNTSRQGNYLAVTVTIMAQSQQQLDNIYLDLTACKVVKMAL
ncbi:MAG: hypothetical protein CSA44_01565 [Gammaproteobacteria bacterium]|nr:MAG: hypothetical protein CSA44_01565 [Gammaproteobacteria bacterium]